MNRIETTNYLITPSTWATAIAEQLQQNNWDYFDILLDQANCSEAEIKQFSRSPLFQSQIVLLDGSVHSDAASAGPILLRFSAQASLDLLVQLLTPHFYKSNQMVLLGHADFAERAQRLQTCVHAEWDRGASKGILRFYDPRLFAVVAGTLTGEARDYLLMTAHSWHWIDRDQHAKSLQLSQLPKQLNAEAILLNEQQVDLLSAWHLAELWRKDGLIEPADVGFNSYEVLMPHIVQAQLAADQAQLWSPDERNHFILRALEQIT